MTRGDVASLAITAWTMSLWALMMTATSQRRGRRTLLERVVWKWAGKRAQRRRDDLDAKVEASDLATLPETTADYVQREDVLFQASSRASSVKIISTTLLSISTGLVLWGISLGSAWHWWRDLVSMTALVGPILITIGFNLWTMGPGMRRWTTEIVTTTARRSYEELLAPFERSDREPQGEEPFHSPHIPAVHALEDFARALEKYALKRALPDGRRPMAQVVRHYAAAAAHARSLRDGVELDREDGRKQALIEVERMLTVLAGTNLRDLAPISNDEESLLRTHRERTVWRRQTLALVMFTLTLVGIVAALTLSSTPIGAGVATVAATFVVASWGKNFGLPTDQAGGGPSS
ncbi:hypothetical protein ACFWY6_24235 [Streptomyces sp. NPDC059037]|uniref:hypothetical protein n=1 Tax=Streptomyces sp. NPDC059037 TaxID=3346710 RepID=UPI00368C4CBB